MLSVEIQGGTENGVVALMRVTGDGAEKLEVVTSSYWNDIANLTVKVPADKLQTIHLRLEKVGKLKRFEIPWHVGPVDWLGRSVK
jgi:hypothetical protein